VRNGVDGLHLALELSYDAIVLDVMMPEMDGWQVLQKLRQHADTPVLFLTARGELEDRLKGLDLGADDYLRIPRQSGHQFHAKAATDSTVNLATDSTPIRPPIPQESGHRFHGKAATAWWPVWTDMN
jgi:CheY-like chemotaxis protein